MLNRDKSLECSVNNADIRLIFKIQIPKILCQFSFSQNNTDMAILFYQRVLQGKQIHILYGLTYLSSVSVYKKGRSDDGTIQKYSLTG